MAVTYTWIVERMSCYPQAEGQTDVVFSVDWRLNGVDGDYVATVYDTCAVPVPGDPFTPYAELTQEQVLGWIWANGVDKNEYETSIAGQIAYQMNPPVITPPLPWA
jgi:hypothetical protein